MRTFLLILILIAALIAYYHYFQFHKGTSAPPAIRQVAPGQHAPLSTGSDALDRITGVTAADQGMKTRDVLKKVKNSPRQQMPRF